MCLKRNWLNGGGLGTWGLHGLIEYGLTEFAWVVGVAWLNRKRVSGVRLGTRRLHGLSENGLAGIG